jgi:hypothetical protein
MTKPLQKAKKVYLREPTAEDFNGFDAFYNLSPYLQISLVSQ